MLAGAATKQEAMRLMVAILSKQGPSVSMIARWFDLREATVYAWFDRLPPSTYGHEASE